MPRRNGLKTLTLLKTMTPATNPRTASLAKTINTPNPPNIKHGWTMTLCEESNTRRYLDLAPQDSDLTSSLT
eukprot:12076025-Heterocapsa_arctica.AAC.1